jgi:hypothetical protein
MNWSEIFKSRSFKWGSLVFFAGAAGGVGGSFALAFKLARYCSDEVTQGLAEVANLANQSTTLPDLSATVVFDKGTRLPINVTDVTLSRIPITAGMNQVALKAERITGNVCYNSLLSAAIGISLALSLAVALLVALCLFMRDFGGKKNVHNRDVEQPLLEELDVRP